MTSAPGDSGTPLVRKLGIKPGHRLLLLNQPPDFAALLVDLPEDVIITRRLPAGWSPVRVDVAVVFSTTLSTMDRHIAAARPILAPAGGLWCAWPKKASGVKTDLNEDVIRELAVVHNLVDNKVCAVSQVWSGLRLVIRLADRPKT